jgi:hypothetical protein
LKSNIEPDIGIREYLLGKFTSKDAAAVEEQLLRDDEFYQELLIVEDELIDEYLAGALPAAENDFFEQHFLATPERREKVHFARNLRKYVIGAKAAQQAHAVTPDFASEASVVFTSAHRKRFWVWSNPVIAYSLAVAALLAIIATVLVVRDLNSPVKPTGRVLAMELTPGMTRGEEGIQRIALTADITTVQLQLRIPNTPDYQIFKAILIDREGRETFNQDKLRRDAAANDRVVCPIPASLLLPGDYSLKLSGLNLRGEREDFTRYAFRVSKL